VPAVKGRAPQEAAGDFGAAHAGSYLTFVLGDEEYGVELLRVREIIALVPITPMPMTKPYLRGVMNLRGRVIPVVDMRQKFAMQVTPDHDRKCIIVVDIEADDRMLRMGCLVDSVCDVGEVSAEDVQAASSFAGTVQRGFIRAVARTENGVKLLLDIDSVLGEAARATEGDSAAVSE
jgi:purine-binding chemotaxis protein CheW